MAEPSRAPTSMGDATELEQLRVWVQRHSGITYSDEQAPQFNERVQMLCHKLGLAPAAVYARITAGDRQLAVSLVDVASTNYTYFLREPETFAFFREHSLRDFPSEPQLRIWSAATSSGDEAYSIAIVAQDELGEHGLGRVRILGTDLSARALASAEAATYSGQQLASIGATRLSRSFVEVEPGRYRVAAALRERCTFRRLNLTHWPWPFEHRFHAVFLRNMLYYFDERLRQAVMERCYDAIAPGGYLFTSLTDPMVGVRTRFRVVRPAVYRRER